MTTRSESFVVDTHAMVWFFLADKRLSRRADGVLRSGEQGLHEIIVPMIVLAEALYLVEKRTISMTMANVIAKLRAASAWTVWPFDRAVLDGMLRLPTGMEMHDRIIAATATVLDSPVVSRDPAFDGIIRTVW